MVHEVDVMTGMVVTSGQRRLKASSHPDEDPEEMDRAPPVEMVFPGASTVDDSSQPPRSPTSHANVRIGTWYVDRRARQRIASDEPACRQHGTGTVVHGETQQLRVFQV